MIFLIQLFKMVEDKELFIGVFSNIHNEIEQIGYEDNPECLVRNLLEAWFGLTIDDENHLKKLTEVILKKKDLSFLRSFDLVHHN